MMPGSCAGNGDLVLILSGDNANKTRVQLCSLRLV